jgi:hypothetical protein
VGNLRAKKSEFNPFRYISGIEALGKSAGPAIFVVGIGDPFAIGRPTERSRDVIRSVCGDELSFRSAESRHKVNARVRPGDTHKSNLCSISDQTGLTQSDG